MSKGKKTNDIPSGFVEACWSVWKILDNNVTAVEFVRLLANRSDTSPSACHLPELIELRDQAKRIGRPDIARAFDGMILRTEGSGEG